MKTLKLKLNPKSQLIPLKNGISFLGFHFYLKDTEISIKLDNGKRRAYRRKFNRMVKKVRSGDMNLKKLEESYHSWREHANYCTEHKMFDYYEKRMKEVRRCALKTAIT